MEILLKKMARDANIGGEIGDRITTGLGCAQICNSNTQVGRLFKTSPD